MNYRNALLVFALTGLIACTHAARKTADDVVKGKVKQLLIEAHESGNFSGSIAVSHNDSLVLAHQLGLANRVWNIPVSAETRFDIASLNKSFVAGLIMLAVEEGKINLEDKFVDVLQMPYSGKFDSTITIHHMLTHTSGLPDYDAIPEELRQNGFARFKRMHFKNPDYVDFISRLKPVATPGTRFYYSNFAYHLLSILLEDIYDSSFNALLQEKICVPLELVNTFNSIDNEAVFEHVAEGYLYDENSNEWKSNSFIDLTLGRRIFSTSLDLQKWGMAMTNNRLFRAESRQIMHKNHLAELTGDLSYGYGWVVYQKGESFKMGDLEIDMPYIIHGGETEGYKSMLVVINNGEWVISILANSGNKTNEMELIKRIVTLLNTD